MTPETVIFDGDCGVCSFAIEQLRRVLPSVAYRAFQTLTADDLRGLGVTLADCTRRVQFVSAAGVVSAGGAACVDLLARMPAPLRLLAPVLRLPFVRALVNAAYDRFAANRAAISRALGLVACDIGPEQRP